MGFSSIISGGSGSGSSFVASGAAQNAIAQMFSNSRLALANYEKGTANFKLAIGPGDSTTMGVGTSLASTYPNFNSVSGNLVKSLQRAGYSAANGGTVPPTKIAGDPNIQWTATAGWNQSNFGAASAADYENSTTTNGLTYTDTRAAYDGYWVYFIVGTTGTFTAQVGNSGSANGSLVTQNVNAGTVIQGQFARVFVGANSASTANYLYIIRTSGDVHIVMVEPVQSTVKTIQVANFGVGGAYSSDWLNNLANGFGGLPLIGSWQPSLAIPSLLVNDGIGSVDVETAMAHMTSIITTLQGYNIDVLLSTMPPSRNADVAATFEALYVPALYSLANQLNVPIFDIYGRWGGTYQTAYMTDDYHPDDAGYQDWTNGLFYYLRSVGLF